MNDREFAAGHSQPEIAEVESPARRFRFTLRTALLAVFLCTVLLGVTRRFYLIYLSGKHRAACANNLKLLLLAMHNYHSVFNCFPPAFVVDDEGKPMHSWRVLLLPYLGEQAIYDDYDFAEPWDGPNNSKLAGRIPGVFVCPGRMHTPTTTNYLGIFGADTLWQGDNPVSIRQIWDGTSNTIALVEVAESDIQWMEPRDYPYGSDPPMSRHRHVGAADGSVRSILLDAAVFQKACTISGREFSPF
jgi:hypothetical protein